MKTFSLVCMFFLISAQIALTSVFASYKDEWSRLKNQNQLFDEKIEQNIKSTFSLNTDGFKNISELKLALLTERDSTLIDILNVTYNFRKSGCIGSPIIYLKPQSAYILVKDKEGKNVLIHMSKITNNHSNVHWKITKVDKKSSSEE